MWLTIRTLDVGQSFTLPTVDSNMRNGLSIAQTLLDRKFQTRREDDHFRIARVA